MEITSHCNQHCRYCFVRALRKSFHMDVETIESILLEGLETGHDTVHLTGGEPLVHPDFGEIIESITLLPYRRIIINTNGTLLNETLARKLAEARIPVRLTISLDGHEAQHEKNRGRSTYRKTIRGLETALFHNLSTTIFTVASRQNIKILPAFLKGLLEKYPTMEGVSLIPVGDVSPAPEKTHPVPSSGENRDESDNPGCLTPEEILELGCISAASIISGRKVTVLDYPLMNLVYRELDIPLSMFGSHCTACRSRICIQADGSITPCHPCWEKLGTYRPGVLRDVMSSRLFLEIKARRFQGCDVCPDKEICGGCRAAVLGKTGDLFARDSSCRMIRSALKTRAPFLAQRVEELIDFFAMPADVEKRPIQDAHPPGNPHVTKRVGEERRPADVAI